MKTQPLYGLVCTGGGARGAYQVGALKYIHEKFSEGKKSPFQIFTGSSCGALNTSFYAAQAPDAYASRLRLEELWLGFHVPAYHGNILKNALVSLYKEWRKKSTERSTAWALLDPEPMRSMVRKGFLRQDLERALAEGATRGIAVAATELISGRTCWFQEGLAATPWNLFHSIGLVQPIQTNHLEASCSVPFFMPPVKVHDHYFLDGSVSLDRPFSAAVSMGVTHLLAIATDQPYPQNLPHYPAGFKPRFSNIIRFLVNELSRETTLDETIQIEMFNRFYGALSRKGRRLDQDDSPLPLFDREALPAHYRPVEVFHFYPSKRIRDTSGMGESDVEKGRGRTRFLFHEKFIREMIGMGYEDARSKHEELARFFNPERVKPSWLRLFKRR